MSTDEGFEGSVWEDLQNIKPALYIKDVSKYSILTSFVTIQSSLKVFRKICESPELQKQWNPTCGAVNVVFSLDSSASCIY